MSLSSRLSGFFLAALGVVLIGFSIALYMLARIYLQHQLDDRMNAALAVLAAAAEINEAGVEWEPHERLLTLGEDAGADRLRWRVEDHRGNRVDESRNLDAGGIALDLAHSRGKTRIKDGQGHPWIVARRRLTSPVGESPEDVPAVDHRGEPMQIFPSLTLTVCAPLDPIRQTLATLAWTLTILSVVVWSIAALLGRALARRALRPLTGMVDSARGLDAADPGWTLEPAGTGDELDELSGAFNELLSRLHVAYERQRRFSTEASHQLRTPLTALIGQIDVALRRDRDADEYRRVLRVLHERAVHLGHIVEALLFLGRADGEAGLLENEPLELLGWIAAYLEDRVGRCLPESVTFSRGDRDEPIWVRAHAPLLGQLLDNLLDNAMKYGQSDEPAVVEVRREGTSAVLTVADRGRGIAPEDLPRLFEPFYRSDDARRLGRSGIGLGLAIAQRIARAFGGTITATSERGQGSRFEVRLPVEERKDSADRRNDDLALRV